MSESAVPNVRSLIPKTVLIVDDEQMVVFVATRILEQSGFRVLSAHTAHSAIELFSGSAQEIDAVILDLEMPGMSGENILRELQRIKPDVRVILSTGHLADEIQPLFVGRGLAGFIAKPYNGSELLREVWRVLDAAAPASL